MHGSCDVNVQLMLGILLAKQGRTSSVHFNSENTDGFFFCGRYHRFKKKLHLFSCHQILDRFGNKYFGKGNVLRMCTGGGVESEFPRIKADASCKLPIRPTTSCVYVQGGGRISSMMDLVYRP